jgi:hypothetical protein
LTLVQTKHTFLLLFRLAWAVGRLDSKPQWGASLETTMKRALKATLLTFIPLSILFPLCRSSHLSLFTSVRQGEKRVSA